MSQGQIKVDTFTNQISIVGPVFVLLCILLLLIRESAFDVHLTVTALFGLLLCSRWKLYGFSAASALLTSVLLYDYFFAHDRLTFWEIGLSASIEMAFLVTSLASLELYDAFKLIREGALSQLSIWETEAAEYKISKASLEAKIAELKEQTKLSEASLLEKNQCVEKFEQLLMIAREELQVQARVKEELERRFFEERQKVEKLKEKVEDADQKLNAYQSSHQLYLQKEDEVKALQKNLSVAQEELAHKIANLKHAEGTIDTLTGQLGTLTDKLKGLLSEKDELEKALDDVLKQEPVAEDDRPAELRRVEGLYLQLRSQFEEKSQILDATRRELFQTQEEALRMSLELAEEKKYDTSGIVQSHQKYLIVLAHRIESLESEIIQLEELIESFAGVQDARR